MKKFLNIFYLGLITLMLPGSTFCAQAKIITYESNFVEICSQTIGPKGGLITVPNSDYPLDGVEIEFPQNALKTEQKISVSVAAAYFEHPKVKVTYGGKVSVIKVSPISKDTSQSGYADDIIKIKIPIPEELANRNDIFGMAFYYIEDKDEIELMSGPSVQDGKFIILTRQFNYPFFLIFGRDSMKNH